MSIDAIMIQGEKARLFPVVSETNKENRIAAIFLALLPVLPDLTDSLFQSIKIRTGTRTKIECFTEVVLKSDPEKKHRPDGLIAIKSGGRTRLVLVEFKIGKNDLEQDQVERYLKLAKDHGIETVVTISNQFVARADHPPVQVSKALLRKVDLFHWSWMSIFTKCQLLQIDGTIEDPLQKIILDEFVRFLEHSSTGVAGFTQMNKGWKDVVTKAKTGALLQKSAPEVEETVAGWLEEQRDICLLLSRMIGKPVRQKIEPKLLKDNILRLKTEIANFCETKDLTALYQVPDAASDILVEADLVRRTIDVSMRVKAPADKQSTKARVNWLLRMIKSDDERIIVRAHWPSKVGHTQSRLSILRENPEAIQAENAKLAPHSFQILLIEPLAGRFAGTRTFIEDMERIVPEFYSLIGQHLKAWQPPAPKLRVPKEDQDEPQTLLTLTKPVSPQN